MNVVLEQLRRKYDVPRGVWHLIVHLFRPRAPPVIEFNPIMRGKDQIARWICPRGAVYTFGQKWGAPIVISSTPVGRGGYVRDVHCPYCCKRGHYGTCEACFSGLEAATGKQQ